MTTSATTSQIVLDDTLPPTRIQSTESKPASVLTTPSLAGKKDGNALNRLFSALKSTDGIRIAACCLQAGVAGWNG